MKEEGILDFGMRILDYVDSGLMEKWISPFFQHSSTPILHYSTPLNHSITPVLHHSTPLTPCLFPFNRFHNAGDLVVHFLRQSRFGYRFSQHCPEFLACDGNNFFLSCELPLFEGGPAEQWRDQMVVLPMLTTMLLNQEMPLSPCFGIYYSSILPTCRNGAKWSSIQK